MSDQQDPQQVAAVEVLARVRDTPLGEALVEKAYLSIVAERQARELEALRAKLAEQGGSAGEPASDGT